MQNQLNKTEVQAITSVQSLASVQTLLKAGLGCIAFMRDLLPNDNFSESHFVTSDDATVQSDSFSSLDLRQKRNMNQNINSFRIMTMTRGYTDEADRLLNYLENGVFDALQRSYLKTFIFAVYLDSKDPNNIVEAYTFNFQYHTLPGTNATIPVMTLADGNGSPLRSRTRDPVAEAISKGKLPTLRDVKRSVKTLLKTLITSMTQMDVLPKRRFASFKMFYTDDTPSDYEPPHFQAADADKDKWFFMTHDLDEAPDTWNIGKVDTGHHAVNVSVTSIATYLPSSTENDSAPFTGTTTKRMAAVSLTPTEEAALRVEQAIKQKEDAETRNVVWEAEGTSDVDAEGDIDEDFVQQKDGSFHLMGSQSEARPLPIGIRNEAGEIEPITGDMMQVDEVVFGGITQPVPMHLNEMVPKKNADAPMIAETQAVDHTPTPKPNRRTATAGGSSPFRDNLLDFSPRRRAASEIGTPCPVSYSADEDIDTVMLEKLALGDDHIEDSEMLDMETQLVHHDSSSLPPESIQSFGALTPGPEVIDVDVQTPKPLRRAKVNDDVVECECGSTVDDCSSFCEGGCERWYHVWCMGYDSAQDTRLPDKFICFDCRLREDPSWELIKIGHYPTMIAKYRELASFRRAIKIAEKYNPETAPQFTKEMGCENNLGKQLFKRLENENFIIEHELVVDDIGFAESRARGKGKVKGKGKQAKGRRNVQKARFVFNYQMKQSKEYADYFNPDPDAESRLLGFQARAAAGPSLVPMPPPAVARPLQDTQTQDAETQYPADLKRPRAEDGSRPKKKVKVSIAPAVDLAE